MIQVLVDADNLSAPRLRALLRAIPIDEADVIVAGSPRALSAVDWPSSVRVVDIEGWQRADMLVEAYRGGDDPLVLVSGDGDFAGVVRGHAGPVLVVSDRPASGLRGVGSVIDPVIDGVDKLRTWFDAVVDQPFDA